MKYIQLSEDGELPQIGDQAPFKVVLAVENPVNPGELDSCTANCWELSSPAFINEGVNSPPWPVAPSPPF